MLAARIVQVLTGLAIIIAMAAGLFAITSISVGPLDPEPAPNVSTNKKTIAEILPRSQEHNFVPPIPGTYQLASIKPAADGSVIGIDGKSVSLMQRMKGKITVLSFIYTLCSDAKGCPLAMATLFETHDASKFFPEIAENARFISLSFDPLRDTPEAMESYAYPVLADPQANTKIPWEFLTTKSVDQLKPILKAYGQVINPSVDGETIAHLLRLYLIDKKGVVRNIYGLGFLDPRLLFADIKTLLMEEKSADGSPS